MAAILIIDDNETIREGLAHTIKKMGHAVATAPSGTAGIALFKQHPADFVITDLKMDGATGVDVLREITAADPDVPILVMTGFGTVDVAVEAMKLGAFDFITKPVAPEMIRIKVERALELCGMRRARRRAEAMTEYLRVEADGKFPDLVGRSDKISSVLRSTPRCSSPARVAPAKSWSRARFIASAGAPAARSSK